jgi:hypothetical protein|tara:strand:+ start:314 stop:574 length:261 start_codon:yes stop_codon:yes gene_type:complete
MEAEKTYSWRIKGPFEIGGVIRPQGREYTLVAVDDYTTKFGRASNLLTWVGTCTKCGQQFQFQSGKSKFNPTATCDQHRPGKGGAA